MKTNDGIKATERSGTRIVFGDADTGIALRREGWLVRDTVLVLLPGARALQGFVVRRDDPPGRTSQQSGGALNIDACRLGRGRWPPNVILVHASDCGDACAHGCPVGLLEAQTGILKSGRVKPAYKRHANKNWSGGWQPAHPLTGYGDAGTGSRFFPVVRNLQDAIAWLETLVHQPI